MGGEGIVNGNNEVVWSALWVSPVGTGGAFVRGEAKERGVRGERVGEGEREMGMAGDRDVV